MRQPLFGAFSPRPSKVLDVTGTRGDSAPCSRVWMQGARVHVTAFTLARRPNNNSVRKLWDCRHTLSRLPPKPGREGCRFFSRRSERGDDPASRLNPYLAASRLFAAIDTCMRACWRILLPDTREVHARMTGLFLCLEHSNRARRRARTGDDLFLNPSATVHVQYCKCG